MILKIGLIIFSILTVIFLVFSFLDKTKIIRILRPIMTISLMIFALIYMKSRDTYNVYILLSLVFVLASNIFLIKRENRLCFLGEIITSLLSVICYIIRIILWLPFKLEYYFYLILVIFFIVWSLIFYRRIKPLLNELSFFFTLYSYVLVCGVGLSVIVCLTNLTIYSLALLVGFLLLVFSDCIIFVLVYNKKVKRIALFTTAPSNFAQICLLIGCIFINRGI